MRECGVYHEANTKKGTGQRTIPLGSVHFIYRCLRGTNCLHHCAGNIVSKVHIGPLGMPAIYEDGGKRITTHSMLKQYLGCPKSAQYKYAERLKPRSVTRRE